MQLLEIRIYFSDCDTFSKILLVDSGLLFKKYSIIYPAFTLLLLQLKLMNAIFKK